MLQKPKSVQEENNIKKKLIVFTSLISTIIYLQLGDFKAHTNERKRVYEAEKKMQGSKVGKGKMNKPQKQVETPEEKEITKEKIVKTITPYDKSLAASKKITESQSRENRQLSASRKQLLKLLKEKIDKKNIRTKSTRFTKGEIQLLRKFDSIKKKIDEEEKILNDLIAQKEALTNQLSISILDTKNERIKITKLLESRKNEDDKKLNNLVKILEGVKPNNLGPLLEDIDEDLFIAIVERMKPKTFANALKYISKEKAVKLNEKLINQ